MDYKLVLAFIGSAITIYAYIPYIKDTLKGKTKPHAFSWFIWFLLTGIAFVAQVVKGGGIGSWILGITTTVTFGIFVLGIFKGEKDIKRSDWVTLILALAAIPLWMLTKDPFLSVILVTVIDGVGFWPTVRKTYAKPHEETLITYDLSAIKFIFAIFALEAYNLSTVLYPAFLFFANGAFAIMVRIRRNQIN